MARSPGEIVVLGAREHNLRNVDVSVPRDALVVFTGVSGSGKSSLAYDTILKEGQRRFLESLSSYARQFLGRMERPDVDAVHGVSPTLAVDQKTVNRNPRSTVGTVTEVYDGLRLLLARLGTAHCPVCGREVRTLTVDRIVDRVLTEANGHRVSIRAPVVSGRKGEHRELLEGLHRDGWTRLRVDGLDCAPDSAPALGRYENHTIEVVVDRVSVQISERGRLAEAVEAATRLASGVLVVAGDDFVFTFSTVRACPEHPEHAIPELEPRLFSFNAPQGACPSCAGLGAIEAFDWDRILDGRRCIPEAFRAVNEEGRLPFASFGGDDLLQVAVLLGAPLDTPVGQWPPETHRRLVSGDPTVTWVSRIERAGREEVRERPWKGLADLVEIVWKYTKWAPLGAFRTQARCTTCDGERLNPSARAVRFRGHSVVSLSRMSVAEARVFFADLKLSDTEAHIGATLVREVRDRLDFLDEVGLGYLGLERSAATLSGGEAQRIRLAAQVGSGLRGVTYVLDEPSVGLHARDNLRLLGALRQLRDRGNSVLVVEHDAETILAADWVVDVGPGAGREGGRVCAAGPPERILKDPESPTGRWLRGESVMHVPTTRRPVQGWIQIRGAHVHNLQQIDVDLPLGVLLAVTGVSGSGKSSLVSGVLEPSVRALLRGAEAVGCASCAGADVDALIVVDQAPIGRTPRSNPATYTGLFDTIRDLFAATQESRARGYKKGRFSFNVAGGRCEGCEGAGVRTIEMAFLPDVEIVCETCNGRRFDAETREVTWHGLSIDRVLELTIQEALALFSAVPKIKRILSVLCEVGLGYVSLGQPSTTLSGGEAQRIKLASELHRPAGRRVLYILDEPTTGLHFSDVERLLAVLHRLVDAGHSVLVVEHHLDVIRAADRVVDLGPEGGPAGGCVVGFGTPEEVARVDTPTGRALSAPALLAEPATVRRGDRYGGADQLVIRGARCHNLQGVDVELPLGGLSVLTGPSGSGKTSLAFDTIFAEGQRRYVECLSTYARRFLGRLERAPVDSIDGLQPAVAVDQRSSGNNPRSTVGTVTEIHDVLRLLYARVGVPHCVSCGRVLRAFGPVEAATALAETEETGWLLADLRPAEGTAAARRDSLVGDGWSKLWSEGVELDLSSVAAVEKLKVGASLVVDRGRPKTMSLSRLSEAMATAYRLAGVARFVTRNGDEQRFTDRFACPEHGVVHEGAFTPRHFSFNANIGACRGCEGVGVTRRADPALLFPGEGQALEALDPRARVALDRSPKLRAQFDKVTLARGPVSGWPTETWSAVLEGLPGPMSVTWRQPFGRSMREITEVAVWQGLRSWLSSWTRSADWVMRESKCPSCAGGRLRPELLAVRIGGLGIHALSSATVSEVAGVVAGWRFDGGTARIAERPLLELRRRLTFLEDVGLGYLALDRLASTLSGGEAQRIRLASQLGAALVGVTYVLDEPTVGLHPRDTDRLLTALFALRDAGNTVVVVEHDLETIRRADHVVDLGPGAGVHGGRVMCSGTPETLMKAGSPTGRWLTGLDQLPPRTPQPTATQWLTLRGASGNNLQGVDLRVPVGRWTGVTGVSGSGKSSLINDTLAPALLNRLGQTAEALPFRSLEVDGPLDGVVIVDQSPIGRSSRSTPATYVGVMDALRTLYAETAGARARGWGPGRFSFNTAGGRCEACEGRGATLVEMHFLPDVWVGCESCGGRRYGRETLEVRWRNHSIADVLSMPAEEALPLFSAVRWVAKPLQALVDVGLGYLSLGQPGHTLSGGESQRLKLASELASRKGHAVYLLDEPTTGLHPSDVSYLVRVLDRLVNQGHTVVTVEHHLPLLRQVDWLIDLGPDAGPAGGRVVAEGTPIAVAATSGWTGRALRTTER